MLDLNCPVFFLGAPTPNGFKSYFNAVYNADSNWRAYILKGGPGTGKSSLMRVLAAEFSAKGQTAHLILCASNPNSLDAVIFPDCKTCVLDGTAPHVLEPLYPGVCEIIVDLAAALDTATLCANADKILPLFKENSRLHERAGRYINAIGTLAGDCWRIALDASDTSKAARFAGNLARREIPVKSGRPQKTSRQSPSEELRFLSAFTPAGLIFLEDTIYNMCDRVISIEDEYGASARVILAILRSAALASGYDIITCVCPMAPDAKVEHIIIPELRLAFCTSNRYHKITSATRRIHARRFADIQSLRANRQKLSFNRRAIKELNASVCGILSEADYIHDKLENYYTSAMDFKVVDLKLREISMDISKSIST